MVRKLLAIGLIWLFWGVSLALAAEDPILHLYCWVDYIPRFLFEEFEKETGIKVIYDVYDSNDVLTAKLMTGSSAYDIVCPSAWPYVDGQIKAGVYQPLKQEMLPNLRYLDPFLLAKLQTIDPDNQYVIPYTWGISGIGYDAAQVKKCMPDAPVGSLRLLFDPGVVKQLSRCGISLLDEAVDVIPLALLYLGLDPNSESLADLERAGQVLMAVRPHITRFSVYQAAHDLGNQELCVVQGWATEILGAQESAEDAHNGAEIFFVAPEEGTSMWVDVFAIPVSAPHPENAHKFIDFMLRPENAARAMNEIKCATAVPAAVPFIDKDIRHHPGIYPPEWLRRKLFVDKQMSPSYTRARSRLWMRIKSDAHE